MANFIKYAISIDILIFLSLVFLFILFFAVFHLILYIIRWYELANNNAKLLKNIDIPDSIFFFMLETGASIYLHFLMLLRNIKRFLAKEDGKIEIISGTERNPAVLIHGYNENNGTMSYLKRSLNVKYGFFNTFFIEYGIPFTFNYEKIREKFSVQIIRLLDQLENTRVDFICHSMGGLMLLEFLSSHKEYKSSVSRIILLGTPLKGSKLAVFNRNSVAYNLRPDSGLVNSLDYGHLEDVCIYSIYSTFDELVLPYQSSKLPDHSNFFNIEFDSIGHMGLLMANRIISKVALLLIE